MESTIQQHLIDVAETEDSYTPTSRHWEDIFIDGLFSVGGLALSNMLVMACMLYFSYTAHPPDPDSVNDCVQNISTLPKSCQIAIPGLQDYKSNSTNLRVAIIVCVGSPIAAYLILTLLKPLGVTLRANGLTSCRGLMSTMSGLLVVILFVMRGVYCVSSGVSSISSGWVCAKSNDPSYRVLNNTLIQLVLVIVCIMMLKLVIWWVNMKSCWACCTDLGDSVSTFRKEWKLHRIKYTIMTTFSRIEPPPYSED